MKHYEHPQLIKRVDDKPLSTLRTRDKVKIIFKCRICEKQVEKPYNAFLQMKDKLCRDCSREKHKEFSREKMKKQWKDEDYRKNISKKVSEGQKRS